MLNSLLLISFVFLHNTVLDDFKATNRDARLGSPAWIIRGA